MPRRKSWVWNHFERSEDGNEATCKLCSEVLKSKGSTSSLNRHLESIHGYTAEPNEDIGVAPKRRCIETTDSRDAMDISTDDSEAAERSLTSDQWIQSTARSAMDVELDDESNDSTVLNRPSFSLAKRTAPPTKINNAVHDASNLSTSATYRGRVRSVAAGARADRPCNRDRTELINQALTKLIVVDMLPLSFVAGTGFRDFMAIVEPNFRAPCVLTVKNRLAYLYEKVTEKIAAELSAVSAVAWTSDCWSSRSHESYVTVTTHFLNQSWIPRSYVLSTEEMSERHTAINLAAKLQAVMSSWKLNGKVSTVVTDNAQNAKNSIRELEHLLIHDGITCAAHSLQLCITKTLKLELVARVCDKASKVVAHFRHSNIATSALERSQEQLGLPKLKMIQSCSTRWDSTYAMLDRLLTNRSSLSNVLSDRSVTTHATAERLEISVREWSTMENLQTILKPLQVATTVLCADTHAPISIVRPIMYSLHDHHLRKSAEDDEGIDLMKETLRDEIMARFHLHYDFSVGINARQIASFLDPRYKDLVVESSEARVDIRSAVRDLLGASDLVDEAQERSQGTAMDFLFQSAPKCNSSATQFDMYLGEPQICHNMNPFEWWATREKRYPALADLARKYLCIPASSASSERVFSTAGNIVSPKRSCLLPENVNLLVFLYQNRELL